MSLQQFIRCAINYELHRFASWYFKYTCGIALNFQSLAKHVLFLNGQNSMNGFNQQFSSYILAVGIIFSWCYVLFETVHLKWRLLIIPANSNFALMFCAHKQLCPFVNVLQKYNVCDFHDVNCRDVSRNKIEQTSLPHIRVQIVLLTIACQQNCLPLHTTVVSFRFHWAHLFPADDWRRARGWI